MMNVLCIPTVTVSRQSSCTLVTVYSHADDYNIIQHRIETTEM